MWPAAAAAIQIPAVQLGKDIPYLLYEDAEGMLTINDLMALPTEAFVQRNGPLTKGYSRAVHWLKFELPRDDFTEQALWMEIFQPYLDDVRLYTRDASIERVWSEQRLGDLLPASARPIDHRLFVFTLPRPEGDLLEAVIRLETTSSNMLLARFWTPQDFASAALAETAFWSFYFGLAAFSLLLTAVMGFLVGSRVLLALLFFGVINYFQIANLYGFTNWVLLRDLPAVADVQVSVTMLLVVAVIYWLLQEVLFLKENIPWLHKAMGVGMAIALLSLISIPLGFYGETVAIGLLMAHVALWAGVIASFYLGLKKGAMFATIGMGLLIYSVSTTLASFTAIGFIQLDPVFYAAWHYSLFLFMLIVLGVTAQRVRLDARERRQQEQLQLDLDLERESNRQQRQFIALVSHEFLNPLGVITGQAELAQLEHERQLGNPVGRFATVERAAFRLKRLFENWLDTNRMLEATLEANREPIDVATWLPRIVRDGMLHRDRPVKMEIEPITLNADPELLKIAINNLLDNASKYSPADSGLVVRAKSHSSEIEISVLDYGPGIPPEHRPHIFDRRFRLQRDQRTPGLGLGLYFTQRIAELHGGRAEVTHPKGFGCCFTLWLP